MPLAVPCVLVPLRSQAFSWVQPEPLLPPGQALVSHSRAQSTASRGGEGSRSHERWRQPEPLPTAAPAGSSAGRRVPPPAPLRSPPNTNRGFPWERRNDNASRNGLGLCKFSALVRNYLGGRDAKSNYLQIGPEGF